MRLQGWKRLAASFPLQNSPCTQKLLSTLKPRDSVIGPTPHTQYFHDGASMSLKTTSWAPRMLSKSREPTLFHTSGNQGPRGCPRSQSLS